MLPPTQPIPFIPGAKPPIPTPGFVSQADAERLSKEKSAAKVYRRTLAKQAAAKTKNQTKYRKLHNKLHNDFEDIIFQHLAHIYPLLEREFKFHPSFRHKFDYCWPCYMVAVELQGGIYSGNRQSGHLSVPGIENDMFKLNLAQSCGWIQLQLSPRKIRQESGYVVSTICSAIEMQRLRGVWR